ncbi:hypothetical protein [Faecalibacterium sp. I3-3-89]|uniref:hypothetical protein n=1 Tax=Faecalibacterium sp. I3-3-89 TaxID=2929493 RepID=UPI002014954A|nr:hypothetical protein [Faecalibacterium sp. I3-3-89]UQK43685.1 hypothetical protein MTP38_03215 [Faecalibacterium sp. I3-3-89]
MKMARRDFLNVSTAAAVVCAAVLLPVEKAAATQQMMAAQELLEQAYLYAFPLVLMDATRKVSTHTETPNGIRAPINQFCHAEKPADAHGLCKISPDIKEANHHEDDSQKLSFHFSGCGVSLRRIPDRARSRQYR